MSDSKFPEIEGATIPLRRCDGAMFLNQHQADGQFEGADFAVYSVIPGGSIVVHIRGEDGQRRRDYILHMRDVVDAAVADWNAEEDGQEKKSA